MNPCLNIRRACGHDARAICRMTRAHVETGLPSTWDVRRVQHLLKRSDTNAYTLVSGRKLAGFSVSAFGSKRIHLVLHAIAPAWHRCGLGKLLLDWQLDAALTAGLGECTLEVRASNRQAQAFYAASGFKVYARVPGYYSEREDALRMRLAPIHSRVKNF